MLTTKKAKSAWRQSGTELPFRKWVREQYQSLSDKAMTDHLFQIVSGPHTN